MSANTQISLLQGSDEWKEIRKKHITSTDASIIMGVNPWKTPLDLYNLKMGLSEPDPINENMQRGINLEEIARMECKKVTNISFSPDVVFSESYPFQMASLDGISYNRKFQLEIKCPRKFSNEIIYLKCPEMYYCQIQHQLSVTGNQGSYYAEYVDGEIRMTTIYRNDEYINKLIQKEKEFYECLLNKIPPQNTKEDLPTIFNFIWDQTAKDYLQINNQIKDLEKQIKHLEKMREEIKDSLIHQAGNMSVQGGGIKLLKIIRKGHIDYSQIQELSGINLDKYRKPDIETWRITENE